MKKMLSELKTKYQINTFDEEMLYEVLNNEEEYKEFIDNLNKFMIYDPGYKFYIYQKIEFLMNQILDISNHCGLNGKEKHILREFEKVKSLNIGFKEEYKSQYGAIKLNNLKVPYILNRDIKFDKIVASDYENVLKLEAFEREFDFEAAESLENDIYFLPTANLIFNEYLDECSDFTFNTIGHIISYPDTDKFDNYKEWIKYRAYQARTLKNYDKVQKQKVKNKSLF